jgi:hypothetical protein
LKSEIDARIARAQDYLLEAKPKSADDLAMRLAGLAGSGAGADRIEAAARTLLNAQRSDGGWPGNPHLESDAYSTGESLYALRESGHGPDPAYRRGVSAKNAAARWFVAREESRCQIPTVLREWLSVWA